MALTSLGYLNLVISDETNKNDHISHFSGIEAYTFRILDTGEEKTKTIRYKVEIQTVKDDVWKPASGKLFLYVNKELEKLVFGNEYMLKKTPQTLSPPMNPGEFNYKRFLSFQNIHYQQFTWELPVEVKENSRSFSLKGLGHRISEWASGVFSDHIDDNRNRNIARALVLGVKDGLDNKIKSAYSASGAMHVLAVSGLHVGIIYLILNALFGRFQIGVFGRWMFAIFVLMVLWMYAIVTGFSPSVLRAVTMFSFVIVAQAINRNSNIYNTLAASGLVLLFFNPYLIMSIGFQLSYLAVLGIVFLQPRIYNLFVFDNYLLDKMWTITAVSIAAQLATFPLGLLYFHQFPTFFLLSNLVVIPGAFIILILGIAVLLSSWFAPIAALLGDLLNFLIGLVNSMMFWIDDLSFSHIDHIYITTWQSWLLIILVFGFSYFLIIKNVKLLYPLAFVFALLMISMSRWALQNESINKITFYRIKNSTAIEWISNKNSVLLSDTVLLNDIEKVKYHIVPNRLRSGVSSTAFNAFKTSSIPGIEVSDLGDKRITIIRDVNKRLSFRKKISTGFLIYSGTCDSDLTWVKNNFDFELLIIGGDVRPWRAEYLVKQCEEHEVPFYSIYHNGALEYEI